MVALFQGNCLKKSFVTLDKHPEFSLLSMIIDHVTYMHQILSYKKHRITQNKTKKKMFILSSK